MQYEKFTPNQQLINKSIDYRPEIDGLRAIAVLSVLIYHALPEWLPSGFIGVDIFFVISGYLITSILIKEILSGQFKFSTFYERRIRRLLPPLLPVLAVTTIFCALLLNGSAYEDFTKSLKATAVFLSNWHFLSSISYFDGPGAVTPLLHTWSLAIEEQFYFVFPILLIIAIRFRRNSIPLFIGALLIASFAYSSFLLESEKSDAAFYNSAARFWELSVGALIATLSSRAIARKTATLLEATGVAMIAWALLTYSHDTKFPGASALLPTVGTGLILASRGQGRVASILAFGPLVFIGLLSYALYLWHWPLMVAVRLITPTPPVSVMLAVIVASTLLAWLSYIWIERPIRTKSMMTTRKSAWICASIAIFGVFSLGAALRTAPIASGQQAIYAATSKLIYPEEKYLLLEKIEEETQAYKSTLNLNFTGTSGAYDHAKHEAWTCSFDQNNTSDNIIDCLKEQAGQENILVMGDSIGRDTFHALRLAFPSKNFIMLHESGCPPAVSSTCFKDQEYILDSIGDHVRISAVILNFRYHPAKFKDVEPGLKAAKNLTPNVYMLGVSPMFNMEMAQYIKSLALLELPGNYISESDDNLVAWSYTDMLDEAKAIAIKENVNFVNVLPFFCDTGKCRVWAEDKYGEFLFWDDSHLTLAGVRSFSSYLKNLPEFAEFL